MLKDKIEALKAQIADLKAENEEALEALRIKYLSKKGEITALFNEFREVAPEEKRELGQRLNELKNLATERINALREATKQKAKEENKIDITRPAFPAELGTRHPISVVRKQIIDIFSRLGFDCRRPRGRGRLARVQCAEFCRRSPCPRHAGHLLHREE